MDSQTTYKLNKKVTYKRIEGWYMKPAIFLFALPAILIFSLGHGIYTVFRDIYKYSKEILLGEWMGF